MPRRLTAVGAECILSAINAAFFSAALFSLHEWICECNAAASSLQLEIK
jgi:hypothetical protein